MAPEDIGGNIGSQSVPIAVRRPASEWWGHSALNTLEHAVTRGSDAATSLLLLWFLSPEWFSKLAVAQAMVAPCLLFFIAPETVIYRDYSKWKAEGPSILSAKITALRRFGYLKALLAVVAALGLAVLNREMGHGGAAGSFALRLSALVWAFAWVLAPQICGADREFLRVDLKLKHLNGLSLFQKLSMLAGTIAVLLIFKDSSVFIWLAAVAVLSAGITAWLARRAVLSVARKSGAQAGEVKFWATVIESIADYSIWQHFIGVIQNWIQTMDVFFLGVLRFAARGVGLYAAVLKIANLSMALPTALANVFTIWLGRELQTRDRKLELRNLWKFTGWISLFLAAQAVLLMLLAPWIIHVLSRGRWLASEQAEMMRWFAWILSGSSLFAASFMISSWCALRAVRDSLFRVFIPWLALSLAVYYFAVRNAGLPGAALANMVVAIGFLGFLGLLYRKVARAS